MATLGGTLDERFFVEAPEAEVRARVADLERHRTAVAEAERVDRVADDTLRFVLKTQRHGPYSVTPDYTVRYTPSAGDLVWTTLAGNFKSEGRASFAPKGAGTEVRWQHSITFDLPIPGLIARGLSGIVQSLMVPGIRAYVNGVLGP